MEYPFVKCLNPQSIVNPYTNERLLVECGKCKACRVRKGAVASMKCKLEALSHKYTMFVTLTYDRYSVPLMDVVSHTIDKFEDHVYINKKEYDKLVCMSERIGKGVVLGNSASSLSFIDELKVKTNTDGLLPFLHKRDIQLFLKRLRKEISKYETEKIRYYAVGEYGPVHFRPHYHLLLWFSSEQTYENIRQNISESWPYGRVDVETSVGKSADYVAKYVNGNCSLPRIYQQKETKPFALHSIRLGEMVLKKNRSEIYSMSVSDFVERKCTLSSKVTDIRVWRSLTSYYFPRCKKYALLDEHERLRAYTTFDEASRIYDTNKLVDLTKCILSDLCRIYEDLESRFNSNFYDYKQECRYFLLNDDSNDVLDKNLSEYRELAINGFNLYFGDSKGRLLSYFLRSCRIHVPNLYVEETYLKFFNRVYNELRLSRHFIDFCCDGMMSRVPLMYRKIVSFWKELDYLNLVHMYEDMETFCENHFESEEDLQMFYVNYPHDMDLYKTKSYYRTLHYEVNLHYENSVKHKKLNDMNNIFKDR